MIKCDKCNTNCDAPGVPSVAVTDGDEDYVCDIFVVSKGGELSEVKGKDLCKKCTSVWIAELLASSG